MQFRLFLNINMASVLKLFLMEHKDHFMLYNQ